MRLRGLQYWGGKRLMADWIVRHLPYRRGYVEPFGGMASVLLRRDPVSIECYNDKLQAIFDWWTIIRDDWESLDRMLDNTPRQSYNHLQHARMLFDTLKWREQSQLERAYWFHVNASMADWGSIWQRDANGHPRIRVGRHNPKLRPTPLRALAKRMKHVTLHNRDAIWVIESTKRTKDCPEEDWVIYCDPPYPSNEHIDTFYNAKVDFNDLSSVLSKSKAYVAISGVGSEWDHLDWPTKVEHRVQSAMNKTRKECLWVNQDLPQPKLWDG